MTSHWSTVCLYSKRSFISHKPISHTFLHPDVIPENGPDFQKKIIESSPYGSTELNFHNWYGFSNRSIVINPQGEVKWSRTDEAQVGTTLDSARQAKLKKRGFIIHISQEKWR